MEETREEQRDLREDRQQQRAGDEHQPVREALRPQPDEPAVHRGRQPNLTRGLVSMGFTDTEIVKILGGNFLRVFERVWG